MFVKYNVELCDKTLDNDFSKFKTYEQDNQTKLVFIN